MSLAKTSVWNGFAMVIKLIASLLANKVVAVWLGPNGLALYGQFQSIMTLVNGLASSPGQAGVIRMTASHLEQPEQLALYWAAAFRAVLVSSCIMSVLGVLSSWWIANNLLLDSSLMYALICFFLCVPFAAFTTLMMSCANGMSEIKDYVIASLISALCVNFSVIVGVLGDGINGVIWAVGLAQVCVLGFTIKFFHQKEWFGVHFFLGETDKASIKKISALATMVIVAVLGAPIIQIAIRHLMSDMYGLIVVGYWQAISRIGDMYLMVLTTLLGVYYFPRFSALKNIKELRNEILRFLGVIYPLFLFGYAVVVLFKEFFITLIYSKEFLPAAHLLVWQMLLDATRVLSWFMGYLVMARGSAVIFVLTEFIVIAVSIIAASFLMSDYGYVGAIYASIIANIIYISLLFISLVRDKKI